MLDHARPHGSLTRLLRILLCLLAGWAVNIPALATATILQEESYYVFVWCDVPRAVVCTPAATRTVTTTGHLAVRWDPNPLCISERWTVLVDGAPIAQSLTTTGWIEIGVVGAGSHTIAIQLEQLDVSRDWETRQQQTNCVYDDTYGVIEGTLFTRVSTAHGVNAASHATGPRRQAW